MATQDWQDTSHSGLDVSQFIERLTVVTIGVFDSGVGGLSILDEALQQLPHHNYIYFADSANAPYGDKPPQWIAERSLQICRYLMEQDCSAIVVACNTATAEAIATIRSTLDIPIIGVEPGIKPAAMQSQNGIVGVLATETTLNSDKFNALLATLPEHCQFIKQAGAGLVPLIEAGLIETPEMQALLRSHLKPILDQGADTLVLGCTHYPFLKKMIRAVVGDSMTLIDTSDAVVRQLLRQIHQQGLIVSSKHSPKLSLLSTANADTLEAMAERLLHRDLSKYAIYTKTLTL
jgi:glutamate racemase